MTVPKALADFAEGDHRINGAPKHGLSRVAQHVVELFRQGVHAATEHLRSRGIGDARVMIAERMGTSAKMLEKWMAASEERIPTAPALHVLLTDEDLLPAAARDNIVQQLAREWGYVAVPQADCVLIDRDAAGNIQAKALEISAGAGRVADAVNDATSQASENGRNISEGERRRIAAIAEAEGAKTLGLARGLDVQA